MPPAIRARGWGFLALSVLSATRVLGDSVSEPIVLKSGTEKGASGADESARRYPGVGAYEEDAAAAPSGPLRWRAEPRLPAEPIFSRVLIPNYELLEPEFVDRPVADLFHVPPCDRWLAIERVIKRRTFREIRRHVRKDWRNTFESGPPITIYDYEERLEEIHRAGREGDVMLASEIFRSGLLGRDSDPPGGEVRIVDWGPVGLTESGRVELDLAETLALPREGGPIPVEIVPGEERPRRAPLFTGRSYRTRTNVELDVRADRFGRGEIGRSVDEASLAVEVEFLTRLRKRRWMELEVEVVTKSSGRLGALVNLSFTLP